MSGRTCNEGDCTRPHLARGKCHLHYYRRYTSSEWREKICTKCGDDFTGSRNARTTLCQTCAAAHKKVTMSLTLRGIPDTRPSVEPLPPEPPYWAEGDE